MKTLLKNTILLKSKFLIFFLKCKNKEEFYSRKKKEFSNGIFKNIAYKLSSPVNFEDQKRRESVKKDDISQMIDQLDMHENIKLDNNFKINVFLEDLHTCSKLNKEPLKRAKECIEDIAGLLNRLKDRTRELAGVFSSIAVNYGELESTKIKDMLEISPKIGKIGLLMKQGFLSLSQIFQNKNSQIKKLVVPMFQRLAGYNKKDNEVQFSDFSLFQIF